MSPSDEPIGRRAYAAFADRYDAFAPTKPYNALARRPKIFREKYTIDLQWKIPANYNARLCAGLRKSGGATTMANNGKNSAQNNRNRRKSMTLGPPSR
jgi:2-polyprenyl-6-hydroxyphenyl methylase/3-demethylubiquinone-9 3-methyltransferase